MDTFEDYISFKNIDQEIISRMNVMIMTRTVHCLYTAIHKMAQTQEPKNAYPAIVYELKIIFHILKTHKDKDSEYVSSCRSELEKLLRGMYEIDIIDGGNDEMVTPKHSPEETSRIMEKSDKSRDLFMSTYKKNKKLLTEPTANVYRIFGKLLFMFNAYQAPPRFDPRKALEDTLGRTDVFTEMCEND